SDPASASSRTCATVAPTSAVSVSVVDCTTIGASPPIHTPPTSTWRVRVRSMGPVRFTGSPWRASLQPQARDVLLREWRQVDRLTLVAHRDIARVADGDGERRCARYGL